MKYYIFEGTFKKVIPVGQSEFQEAIIDHLALLQKGHDEANEV